MSGDGLAHLVRTLQGEIQNALRRRLGDGGNACAGQVLAQQHAEHGRLLRIFRAGLCKMDPGPVGAGGHQKPPGTLGRAEQQHQGVPLRLMDFIDARAAGALKLLGDSAEKYGVKWH